MGSICAASWDDLPSAQARIRAVGARYEGGALVEEYLPGREFNVSIVCVEGVPRALPIREIDYRGFPGARPLLTYASKWDPQSADYRATPVRLATDLPEALRLQLNASAISAFLALGLRDYGRVDFRLDQHGEPKILEVNANPDFGPGGGAFRSGFGRGTRLPRPRAHGVRGGAPSPRASRWSAAMPRAAPRTEVEIVALDAHHRASPAPHPDRLRGVHLRGDRGGARTSGSRHRAEGHLPLLRGGAARGSLGLRLFRTDAPHRGIYDLYWIVVDPKAQGAGVGQALLRAAEAAAAAAGGRKLLIETASKPEYAATRAFYDRAGYAVAARVRDFYRVGDDKLIYERGLRE
jgi:ribosomal protein S18 acetylase RimI-like enzyme